MDPIFRKGDKLSARKLNELVKRINSTQIRPGGSTGVYNSSGVALSGGTGGSFNLVTVWKLYV